MEHRRVGKSDILVSAVGFGCMGLSEPARRIGDEEGKLAIRRALDCGITHFDTADMYGNGANETLVGAELRAVRSSVVLATKCGILRDAGGKRLNGTPAYVRTACEASLRRLNTDYVDLFYLHRVDPAVPIEDTVGAMADLVRQGKARCLGLSKVDAATLARASSVHAIAAVEMQYSVWARQVEMELLGACRLADVALVAYSPLCKGLATDRVMSTDPLPENDRRRSDSRFRGEGLARSRAMFQTLHAHAASNGCTPAQLALAWLLSRGSDVMPIPGMRTRAHVEENVRAPDVKLSEQTLKALQSWEAPVAQAAR